MKKIIVIISVLLVFCQILIYALGILGTTMQNDVLLNISRVLTLNSTRKAIINAQLGAIYIMQNKGYKSINANKSADKYFGNCSRFKNKNSVYDGGNAYQACMVNKIVFGINSYYKGDIDTAQTLFNEASKFYDTDYMIAKVYIKKKDYPRALSYASKLDKDDDKTADNQALDLLSKIDNKINGYALLALIYRNLGKNQMAYRYLQLAKKSTKDNKLLQEYNTMYNNYKTYIEDEWLKKHFLYF